MSNQYKHTFIQVFDKQPEIIHSEIVTESDILGKINDLHFKERLGVFMLFHNDSYSKMHGERNLIRICPIVSCSLAQILPFVGVELNIGIPATIKFGLFPSLESAYKASLEIMKGHPNCFLST